MKKWKKVLVILDGNKASEVVFPALDAFLGSSKPELHLIRVIRPYSIPYVPFVNLPKYRKECTDRASRYLDEVKNRTMQKGSTVITHIRVGNEPREIDHVARDQDIDLIVFSTLYTRWFNKIFRGNLLKYLLKSHERNILLVGSV